MTSLSVIIPTRNRREQILEVGRVVLGDPAVSELLIADDGSDDGTPEALQKAFGTDGRLRVLAAGGKGKSHAEQMGLEAATSEIVLFLDDDVLPKPGLGAGHIRNHEQRQDLIVVGYMPIVDIAPGPDLAVAKIYQQDYERICKSWETDPTTILHNLWGGNISLRREDAIRIGMQSPDFPGSARHVDRDFGLRCLVAGLVGVFDRSLFAVHLYERSLDVMLADARWQGTGLVHVHSLHQDIIGPFDPRNLSKSATWQRVMVVRLGMSRIGHRPIVLALRHASRLAGQLKCYGAEIEFTRMLRKSEQAFHARAETKRLGRP